MSSKTTDFRHHASGAGSVQFFPTLGLFRMSALELTGNVPSKTKKTESPRAKTRGAMGWLSTVLSRRDGFVP
jgi:hypothetical protein